MAAPFPALPDPDDMWPEPPVDHEAEQATLGLRAGAAGLDAHGLALHLAEDDQRWRIADASEAEWAMAKLANAQRNLRALDDQLAEYMGRVRDWHANARVAPSRDEVYFTALLMLYAWTVRAESLGDVMTVKLPSGEVPTRKAPEPKAAMLDDGAVVAWALLHHPEIVQTTYKVTLTALRSVAQVKGDRVVAPNADGELEDVPGTIVEPGDPWAKPKPYETS